MYKYRYINYYKRRTPSGLFPNTVTLTWNIWDNELTDAWATVIRRKLSQADITPRDYSAHTSFPACQDKYKIFSDICKNVEIARRLRPELEWPSDINQIDQDKLNYLHERFHESQEFVLSNPDARKSMTSDGIDQIREAFNKINHDIHSLENIIQFQARDEKSKTDRQNYHVINFGLYDGDLRLPVTENMRKEFWRERELPEYKAAQLWLGYATVGKNLLHCVINDDPEVVRDDMLRPQIDIGGESLAIINNGDLWKRGRDNHESRHASWQRRLEEFMSRHDLYQYVNHNAPEHFYGKQPSLGVCGDEHNSWTEEDYYRLFTEYKLDSVELLEI